MTPVEIEEAVSELAERPFDASAFPYQFLVAFGAAETTIRRLRSGASNKSDLGGVLQANNIHMMTCAPGAVGAMLKALRDSPATQRHKVKLILATDGDTIEAEDLASDAHLACAYAKLGDNFGFFLPLAGISTVKEIRESSFDIKATGRLNRLYVELLKDNADWGTADRRHDMNHFMARLIFCFFAEDTDIFHSTGLFTRTVEQMSARDASNTHEVIAEIFRAMNTPTKKDSVADGRWRKEAGIRSWADIFPYVNGGLFSGATDVPRFSKIARSYLLNIGGLDWKRINPDIFGSMIQAVADDEERGAIGMHYTSVPNILKVLNPLFLDDLREKLAEAGDNGRKLLNLRNRMARIRVFDPACGSGNFLVIAYKEMRAIEAEINKRRNEADRKTVLPLTNFRGIEIRDFPAEIARLALIIAEYQCDVLYRGQKEALAEFLPLDAENWITCGNALRLDWLSVCPPAGAGVKLVADDLLETPLDQPQIDFENEGGETYICGNPPYRGSTWQTDDQKADLRSIFEHRIRSWATLDYVAGWFMKACDYGQNSEAESAFVATNSICQGQQVPILWPLIFSSGHRITFAHTSFKWANLASHKAGVTVVVVGVARKSSRTRRLFDAGDGAIAVREVPHINAYLISGADILVEKRSAPTAALAVMDFGNKPVDGGHLLLDGDEVVELGLSAIQKAQFVRRIYGSSELIRGHLRYCLWIDDSDLPGAIEVPAIRTRIEAVRDTRSRSRDRSAVAMAARAHQFREMNRGQRWTIAIGAISSESRAYLPVSLLDQHCVVTNKCYALYDAPLWNMALIASRLHWVWIGTVCVRMRTDFSYSNTLGWNTFPVPTLTDQRKADLTRCAEDILLAREHYWPATIADMYDPDRMDTEFPLVREAHERNDETLERIYIGRRFKNDTERLEKLFDMYTKMTAAESTKKASTAKPRAKKKQGEARA